MGHQPIEALGSDEVAVIFLAAHLIEPESRYAFQELRCEISDEQFKQFKARVERRELQAITPPDATAARAVLLEIVDRATERLRKLEAKHQKVADQLEAMQQEILKQDRSKTGEQFHRLWGSCDRQRHRNIDAIHKIRRNEAQGWGVVRDDRARRREEKRRQEERRLAVEADPRLVLDEHGTVRYAYDYDGDVEAGLARYNAGSKWAEGQADAAIARSEDGGRRAEEVTRGTELDAPQIGATREGGTAGAGVELADPVIVAGTGEASNVQNEVPPGGMTDDGEQGTEPVTHGTELDAPQSGATREGGPAVADVEWADPVIVAGTGEASNVQNEVTPGGGTEDGGRGAEETARELALDGPRSGLGEVATLSVATREFPSGGSMEDGGRKTVEGTVHGVAWPVGSVAAAGREKNLATDETRIEHG